MLLIMVGVYQMVNKGYQFYRITQAATDGQRSGLALMTRLNSSLQNAKPVYIAVDPSNKGISYCSPFDDDNKVLFVIDPVTNASKITWQYYECLFLTPDQRVLLGRKKIPVPGVSVPPPDDPAATAMPADFLAVGKGKFIAENVSRLEFLLIAKGDPLPYGGVMAASDCYVVTFEAGNKADPGGYWLKLVTTITPRNQ